MINRPVKSVAMSWLTSAPIVACVPRKPGSLNESMRLSFHALHDGRALEFVCRGKSCVGHPLLRISRLVASALLRIDQNVDGKGGRPGRRCPAVAKEPVLDDQPARRHEVIEHFPDE